MRAISVALVVAVRGLLVAGEDLMVAGAGVLVAGSGLVQAQAPVPPGENVAAFAARRFPQPVRVGQLQGLRVLQPVESRTLLGRVSAVVRRPDGKIDIVVNYGGTWGWGGRLIAVPVEAMALLGGELEILDFTPAQLDGFPTFETGSAVPVAGDEIIRMGLAHPSH